MNRIGARVWTSALSSLQSPCCGGISPMGPFSTGLILSYIIVDGTVQETASIVYLEAWTCSPRFLL